MGENRSTRRKLSDLLVQNLAAHMCPERGSNYSGERSNMSADKRFMSFDWLKKGGRLVLLKIRPSGHMT